MNERDTKIASVVYGSQWTMQDMEFADLIRADEREACAKVADKYSEGQERNYSENIADEIRARGNT